MGVNFLEGLAAPPDESGMSLVRVGPVTISTLGDAPGEVFLAFSPADVTLSLESPAGSALNVLEGRVTALLQLGGRMRVDLDASVPLVAELTLDSVARLGLEIGSCVYASFKATAIKTYR
jgi:molybdopterin-binding protein